MFLLCLPAFSYIGDSLLTVLACREKEGCLKMFFLNDWMLLDFL